MSSVAPTIRYWLQFAFVVLAVVIAFVLAENVIDPPRFASCLANEATTGSLWRQAVCGLGLVDRHNGFFALLGTLFVAGFTGTLWWVTRGMMVVVQTQRDDSLRAIAATEKAAEAARKSAEVAERTFVEHDRPWVFRDEVRMTWRKTPGVIANDWMVSISWKNIGRNPALISAFEFCFQDSEVIQDTPDYSLCRQVGVAPSLAAGERFETQPVGIGGGHIRADGMPTQFVMYGRLTYTDMAGRKHYSGFALDLAPIGCLAIEHRNAAYNYYT